MKKEPKGMLTERTDYNGTVMPGIKGPHAHPIVFKGLPSSRLGQLGC